MQKTQKRAASRRRQSPPPLPTLTTITQRDQPTPERAGTGGPPSPIHTLSLPDARTRRAWLSCGVGTPASTLDSCQKSAVLPWHYPGSPISNHRRTTTILYLISAAPAIVPRPSRVSGPRPAPVRGGGDANTLHPIHPVHPITQSTPSPNHPINPITQSPNRPQPRRGHLGLTSLPQRTLVYCQLRRPLSLHPASMPS
jgi:hypothetical protein